MLVLLSMVILVYFWSWILIFTRQCPLTCIDDMHIDMLGVAGAGVALVLPGVLLRSVVRVDIVKLRQGSGKDRQGMALKAKGLKA